MTISPYSTFFWRGDNAQPMLVRRRFRSANGVRIRIIVIDAGRRRHRRQNLQRQLTALCGQPSAPLFDGTDADIRARTPLTRGR